MTDHDKSVVSAPINAASILLETERLLLRGLHQDDLTDIHEIYSMPEVAESAGWSVSESTEMSKARLQQYIADNETLAIVLKEDKKIVGTVSLQKRDWADYPIDGNRHGREFGFDLNKNYWGRGLMPEAVTAVCEYCFSCLRYDFLTVGHFVGNYKSERTIQKCGFLFLFESEVENPGKWKKRIRTYIQYNPHKEI